MSECDHDWQLIDPMVFPELPYPMVMLWLCVECGATERFALVDAGALLEKALAGVEPE